MWTSRRRCPTDGQENARARRTRRESASWSAKQLNDRRPTAAELGALGGQATAKTIYTGRKPICLKQVQDHTPGRTRAPKESGPLGRDAPGRIFSKIFFVQLHKRGTPICMRPSAQIRLVSRAIAWLFRGSVAHIARVWPATIRHSSVRKQAVSAFRIPGPVRYQ